MYFDVLERLTLRIAYQCLVAYDVTSIKFTSPLLIFSCLINLGYTLKYVIRATMEVIENDAMRDTRVELCMLFYSVVHPIGRCACKETLGLYIYVSLCMINV